MEKHQIRIQKNKFKISTPTLNDTFDLPDGSYSISDIQDYFEFIIKKHETLTENLPIQIYPNKIKNRVLGSTKKDVDADKSSENVPKLESDEVVLVHCNLVKNDYQYTSKVLFSFVPNKQLIWRVNETFTTFFNNDEYS